MDASPVAKKRKAHEAGSLSVMPHPIVALNVGGAPRTVRRSLLLQLRAASASHPLVDVLLSPEEHWSRVPTIKDADGTIRVYLDRDPRAFDDLLDYVEYGVPFLESLVRSKDGDGGARLERLRAECDFFTVGTLSSDIDRAWDRATFGQPVAFRADGWASVTGMRMRGGWDWGSFEGNEAIASRVAEGLGQCEVQRTGTYLVFFSLHSVAVTAMAPSQGYRSETNDEFCTLGVFHKKLTTTDGGDWTYPVVRCGAFDYREDSEERGRNPLLVTAACAEPLTLRKGNVLYAAHGTGVETPPETRQSGELVWQHSPQTLKDSPQCVNYLTLVAVDGENIAKFNVDRMEVANGEATTVPWNNETTYFPAPSGIPPLRPMVHVDKTKTRIEIQTGGHYLLLGRVAAKMRENYSVDDLDDWPTVQLELRTESGRPLHIIPDIVSYPKDSRERPYNEKLADYGHINDIVYAEKGTCIEVKAKNGACVAQHGSVPVSFEKLPTQNLSIMRLKPSTRMDRYNISLRDCEVHFERALGGDEMETEPSPLFAIDDGGDEGDQALKAVADCHYIVFGSLSSMSGHIATLLHEGTGGLIASQLSKEGGCGSHTLNGVLTLKKDDCIYLRSVGRHDIYDDIACCGHLAFVALDS